MNSRGDRVEAGRPLDRTAFDAAFAGLADARSILCAASGGPDSTALLHALAVWCEAPGRPALAAATVDHGLRPGSRGEADAVASTCAALGVAHAVLPWTERRSGRVSQEAARRARYRLLVCHAAALGCSHLATAHTLDDQAETLLIRLAAGSGLSGLAGMRPEVRRGDLRHVRPFLAIPKSRLVATCRREGWSFVEDPSNRDPAYARVRWRRLMPDLAAEGLSPGRLARLAGRLGRADRALDAAASAAFARHRRPAAAGSILIDGAGLAGEPEEVALRVLARAVAEGPPAAITGPRLDRLEACLAALREAILAGHATRRTLSGRLVALDRNGIVTVMPEPSRRRGRREALTEIADAAPPSLGIG